MWTTLLAKNELESVCNLEPRLGKGSNRPNGWASLRLIMRLNTKQSWMGVNLAKSLSLIKLIIRSDSQLVVGQVNEEYKT